MQRRVKNIEFQWPTGISEKEIRLGCIERLAKLQLLQGYNHFNLEQLPLVFCSTTDETTLRVDVLRDNDHRPPTVYQGSYTYLDNNDLPRYQIILDEWYCWFFV